MILIAAIVFWSMLGIVAYTYCVFPVLLAVLARLRAGKNGVEDLGAAEVEAREKLPKVTMVVAAYNESAVLRAKLANTLGIDYPADRFELLIGSDGSEDSTAEILEAHAGAEGEPRIRYRLFAQRRGKISVLNDLLAEVDSEIVVMSDANTMFAPDAILQLVRHFADPRVGCVSGQLSLDQDGGVSGEGLYWRYEGWIKRNESRLGFLIGCNGGIFALRRELYEPLPTSTIVEDFVLTLRVLEGGHLVILESEARATEPACVSSRAEMVRKIRIGAGGWQALGLNRALLHPRFGLRAFAFWGHKVLRWLAPCFLTVALLANIALATVPFYGVLLGLQALGLIVAALAYIAGDKRPLPRWTRPASYFYLMNYALFCGLLRFVLKKQSVTWDRAHAAHSRTHATAVVRETAPVSD
jgi:cellulose synthase/poly-beta-1,6-N-acetylglucosamine synthase-like glycosyltransferase